MNRLTYWGISLSFTAYCLSAATQAAYAQSAHKLFNEGRAAEARDDVEAAYQDYAKAFQKKPSEELYKAAYFRLRLSAAAEHVEQGERLRNQGDNTGALTEFFRAVEIDPGDELASQEIRATREKMAGEAKAPPPQTAMAPGERTQLLDLGAPPELKPLSSEPVTLHMSEDAKVIYQAIGKAAGINVLFDPDYHSTRVQLDLANVDFYDALRILGAVSGTFWQPVTSNTIFVAQNTRGKRAELDEEAVQTFYLTNVSQQSDLNDIQTALRNIFATGAKLYAVPSQNAIIMRGTPDELLLAGKLINDLDKARPEVVVDIAVLEVSRDKLREIGIQLPQTIGINFQQSNANASTATSTSTSTTTASTSTTTSALTLNNLAHLNSTNFAVTIGAAQVEALLSDTSTKIIQNPRLRATDGQEAQVKIGEKLPVAQGSYQAGVATAITSSLVNTQFTYLDVGVNIDMKPIVHYDNDVSMKLKIDVSSTDGTEDLGGIDEPIITQRTSDQTIRVPAGEATVLGGILQHQGTKTISGTPGLGELPLLKYLFSTRSVENTDDEIIFLITPHIVRAADLSPLNLRQIDTGTTSDIELRHLNQPALVPTADNVGQSQGQSPASGGNSAPKAEYVPNMTGSRTNLPPGMTNPTAMNGTVPGQTVSTSAVAALAPGAAANAGSPAPVTFQLVPSNATQSVGNTFQEQVVLQNGRDVYAVPMQVQYDQKRLELINVDVGDLLGRDGQSVALVHRVDNGNVVISTSRPPGVGGISGSGSICTLTFKALAPGDASIAITRPVVRNSHQQAIPAQGAQGVVRIQ